ncbi:hypothetical protein B0H19DRAFT_1075842 [Mycena capillaripes]|nr:hypothetical protein B0H19DRAFT_1075842 [Mycena capillaripes]
MSEGFKGSHLGPECEYESRECSTAPRESAVVKGKKTIHHRMMEESRLTSCGNFRIITWMVNAINSHLLLDLLFHFTLQKGYWPVLGYDKIDKPEVRPRRAIEPSPILPVVSHWMIHEAPDLGDAKHSTGSGWTKPKPKPKPEEEEPGSVVVVEWSRSSIVSIPRASDNVVDAEEAMDAKAFATRGKLGSSVGKTVLQCASSSFKAFAMDTGKLGSPLSDITRRSFDLRATPLRPIQSINLTTLLKRDGSGTNLLVRVPPNTNGECVFRTQTALLYARGCVNFSRIPSLWPVPTLTREAGDHLVEPDELSKYLKSRELKGPDLTVYLALCAALANTKEDVMDILNDESNLASLFVLFSFRIGSPIRTYPPKSAARCAVPAPSRPQSIRKGGVRKSWKVRVGAPSIRSETGKTEGTGLPAGKPGARVPRSSTRSALRSIHYNKNVSAEKEIKPKYLPKPSVQSYPENASRNRYEACSIPRAQGFTTIENVEYE